MILRLIAMCLAAALTLVDPSAAQENTDTPKGDNKGKTASCPTSRAHLEPKLKTRPDDGELYTQTLRSVRMDIATLLRLMGGPDRARGIATRTRENAEEKLAAGAKGAEKRYHEDTILRADALIAILDCLKAQTSI
ncbi:MAG: hypothetical protein MJE12_07745 [Alphaproteobacteria bacterium]|nr:hypothetical protein [Alphaproteobacteria bacterium]